MAKKHTHYINKLLIWNKLDRTRSLLLLSICRGLSGQLKKKSDTLTETNVCTDIKPRKPPYQAIYKRTRIELSHDSTLLTDPFQSNSPIINNEWNFYQIIQTALMEAVELFCPLAPPTPRNQNHHRILIYSTVVCNNISLVLLSLRWNLRRQK